MAGSSGLEAEVAKFREWAANPANSSGPDWEGNYPYWQPIWKAAEAALHRDSLTEGEVAALLYVMARDSEDQWILEGLKEPESPHGMTLARAAVTFPEKDARWQMVDFLATRGDDEVISLLRTYMEDGEEFVRRRALYALMKLDAPFAEEVAQQWVEHENPYSRIAALVVLSGLSSAALGPALERLQADENPLVRTTARDLVSKAGQS